MISSDAGREASARLRRVGWFLHARVVETKFRALERTLKAFDPDQPRVPAGDPDGGQWTGGSGGGTGGRLPSGPGTLLDLGESDASEPVRLAAKIPRKRRLDFPRIPRRRPKTVKERNRALRDLAKFVDQLIREDAVVRVAEVILDVLRVGDWFRKEYSEALQTHINPPRTLEELHEDVFTSASGTQVHHIVEQTSADQDGFPRTQIDAPDNLVRIPIVKHEAITRWYSKPNPRLGGLTPRNYLRGKPWAERRRMGLDAMIKYQVLKP